METSLTSLSPNLLVETLLFFDRNFSELRKNVKNKKIFKILLNDSFLTPHDFRPSQSAVKIQLDNLKFMPDLVICFLSVKHEEIFVVAGHDQIFLSKLPEFYEVARTGKSNSEYLSVNHKQFNNVDYLVCATRETVSVFSSENNYNLVVSVPSFHHTEFYATTLFLQGDQCRIVTLDLHSDLALIWDFKGNVKWNIPNEQDVARKIDVWNYKGAQYLVIPGRLQTDIRDVYSGEIFRKFLYEDCAPFSWHFLDEKYFIFGCKHFQLYNMITNQVEFCLKGVKLRKIFKFTEKLLLVICEDQSFCFDIHTKQVSNLDLIKNESDVKTSHKIGVLTPVYPYKLFIYTFEGKVLSFEFS